MVGSLNMTDPTQQCPDSWQRLTAAIASCGKRGYATCESLNIPTSGASYHTVCGWFRGYQVGTPDGFQSRIPPVSLETFYVDGISITYGLPGKRHHVFTYTAATHEVGDGGCPCAGGHYLPPSFVGTDYYCESGLDVYVSHQYLYPDVLWDGKLCRANESKCCDPPNLPWFCKTFPTPISEDLEVRICTDQSIYDENMAIESFELYILGEV